MEDPTIVRIFERQDENNKAMEGRLKEFIQVSGALNYQKIVGKLDPIEDDIADIKAANVIMRGSIEKNADDIDCLRGETRFGRWVQRRPLQAAIGAMIVIMMGAYGYHKINFKKTVENTTGVVIEELDKR